MGVTAYSYYILTITTHDNRYKSKDHQRGQLAADLPMFFTHLLYCFPRQPSNQQLKYILHNLLYILYYFGQPNIFRNITCKYKYTLHKHIIRVQYELISPFKSLQNILFVLPFVEVHLRKFQKFQPMMTLIPLNQISNISFVGRQMKKAINPIVPLSPPLL